MVSGRVVGGSLHTVAKIDAAAVSQLSGSRGMDARVLSGVYSTLGYSIKSVVRFIPSGGRRRWKNIKA